MLRSTPTQTADITRLRNLLLCFLVGHDVDNGGPQERCICDQRIFAEDGSPTRIRTNLSCFLFHHTYAPMGERHGHGGADGEHGQRAAAGGRCDRQQHEPH